MESITRKPLIREATDLILDAYRSHGLSAAVDSTHHQLLSKKVRFPLLEYAATLLMDALPHEQRLAYCEGIARMRTIGGNVLIGIFLQQEGASDPKAALQHAVSFTADADAWYVCDIIGERTFGFLLLQNPALVLKEMEGLASHPSNWVIRSMGAGAHYAIKKGLPALYVASLFNLLIHLAQRKGGSEIRQGIGWAAKTTAKFHPEIIQQYENSGTLQSVPGWFRTKINIGLQRHQYAKGN